jgi:hypothetical protein
LIANASIKLIFTWRKKQREPSHNDEEPAGQIRLQQMVTDLPAKQDGHDHSRVNAYETFKRSIKSDYFQMTQNFVIETKCWEMIKRSNWYFSCDRNCHFL